MEQPIRILQFPGTMLYGGVGSVVMNLYRNIDRKKIQFDFCVPRNQRGPLDDEIESLGGRIFYAPQMRQKGFKNYIETIIRIIRDNGPYKYVHIHSIHMGAVTLYAAKRTGTKVVYHSHNTQDPALESMPFHTIIEHLLKAYIRKNANVRLACGVLAGKYIYGNQTFKVINNAVDLNRFYPYGEEKRKEIRHSLNFKEQDIVVGDIARFVKEKNQSFFLELASYDKASRNRIKFLLVGDGEEKNDFEKQIKEKALEDKFVLTGNRKDVETLYNAMDVFCLPSLFEGLPVSLMEAQASGLPCIISDTVSQEGNCGASEMLTLSLSAPIDKWLDSLYSLSNKRIENKVALFDKFSSHKYEIGSIAKEIETIYLQ